MVRIINILLSIGVFVALYFLYRTIQEPIEFNASFKERDEQVIEKLTYIKDLQLAYKDHYNKFAASFDSLAYFVKNDSITITKIIGDKDELDDYGNAVEVTYEVTKKAVKDSLSNPKFDLTQLAAVPGVEGESFTMNADKIERGRIDVPVFEVSTTYKQMLKGLKEKYIKEDEVRKVGSMYEPNYNGNW
ncbi:MAG: hypothetical protein R2730_07590 [Chitinophagales bacterium]